MVPQHKGVVPDRIAARLRAAGAALEAAKTERDAAVVTALRAGGSTRVVAELVGMSNAQVAAIGKAAGWPDQAELDRRAAVQAERHRWDHLLGPEKRP